MYVRHAILRDESMRGKQSILVLESISGISNVWKMAWRKGMGRAARPRGKGVMSY